MGHFQADRTCLQDASPIMGDHEVERAELTGLGEIWAEEQDHIRRVVWQRRVRAHSTYADW